MNSNQAVSNSEFCVEKVSRNVKRLSTFSPKTLLNIKRLRQLSSKLKKITKFQVSHFIGKNKSLNQKQGN